MRLSLEIGSRVQKAGAARGVLGILGAIAIFFSLVFSPALTVHAHEVYVLTPSEVTQALMGQQLAIKHIIASHSAQTGISVLVALALLGLAMYAARTRWMQRCMKRLGVPALRQYAPLVARLTLGISLVASSVHSGFFGPELPIPVDTEYGQAYRAFFFILGILLVFGIRTRFVTFLSVLVFLSLIPLHGSYIFNYIVYLGLMIFVWASAHAGKEAAREVGKSDNVPSHDKAFAMFRVAFGFSLIFASLYAKFVHADLALQTVTKYGLDTALHLDPHFLVFGAMMTEIALGIFFILGLELRLISVFLAVTVVAALLSFNEVLWPHLVLIGAVIIVFFHGADEYSLERRIDRRMRSGLN